MKERFNMRTDKSLEAIEQEIQAYYGWFTPKNVEGAEGVDTQLYIAMKRDFEALLAWLQIEPKEEASNV